MSFINTVYSRIFWRIRHLSGGGRRDRVCLEHPMRGTPIAPCFATQESQRVRRLCRSYRV
eukprot:10142166-Karenia_brevis.AAC.1